MQRTDADDGIVAGIARQRILARGIDQGVVARNVGIDGLGAADDEAVAVDGVVAETAFHRIGVVPADQRIVARIAFDRVVAVAAVGGVVAIAAVQYVVAAIARDAVVARACIQPIAARFAVQRVVVDEVALIGVAEGHRNERRVRPDGEVVGGMIGHVAGEDQPPGVDVDVILVRKIDAVVDFAIMQAGRAVRRVVGRVVPNNARRRLQDRDFRVGEHQHLDVGDRDVGIVDVVVDRVGAGGVGADAAQIVVARIAAEIDDIVAAAHGFARTAERFVGAAIDAHGAAEGHAAAVEGVVAGAAVERRAGAGIGQAVVAVAAIDMAVAADGVVAGVAVEVAGARDDVVAGAAMDRAGARDHIVVGKADERIDRIRRRIGGIAVDHARTGEGVLALAADQRAGAGDVVVAALAVQIVFAALGIGNRVIACGGVARDGRVAVDRVVAVLAEQQIALVAAQQQIVAVAAIDRIEAIPAVECVGIRRAVHDIAVGGTERVLARAGRRIAAEIGQLSRGDSVDLDDRVPG